MRKSSANGQIFTCDSCNNIHLEFFNVAFDFRNLEVLKEFSEYLANIDAESYEEQNRNISYRRKVIIPFDSTAIRMLLTSGEVNELYNLCKDYIEDSKPSIYDHSIRYRGSNDFPELTFN